MYLKLLADGHFSFFVSPAPIASYHMNVRLLVAELTELRHDSSALTFIVIIIYFILFFFSFYYFIYVCR
jgi:hypothetical protein